jgi:hypothetical protein
MTAVILGAGGSTASGAAAPVLSAVRSLKVTSSNGSVDLLADPFDLLRGPSGLAGAPFDVDLATSPSFDGAVLRSERRIVGSVDLLLPLLVRSSSTSAVAAALADLRRVLSPYAEDVQLVGSLESGATLSLPVMRYQAEGDSWWNSSWVAKYTTVPLRLRALDPWWSGDQRSRTWSVGGAGGSFFPILPLSLAESSVLGEANPLEVGGDLDTWPTWTITGPFTSLTITRGDGVTWSVDEPLLTGETLTVLTDPRETGRVSHSVDGNWWQYVAPGSELFRLRTESESVLVEAVGADATTTVTVAWSPRFEVLL